MNRTSDAPARRIDDLLARGTKGGWWALAGFSFQAAVYLERFFRGVHAGTVEPGRLAQMERLSDIFAPDDEYIRLIQVKRTLEREGLRSALREAYGIASRCNPALLERIRFQVVCLNRATPKDHSDISRKEVEGADDPDLWLRTLAQFDPDEPVLEAPDPLDRLHYLLWECGLRDTQGFLELCRGKLLGAFDEPTAGNIERLARELASLFRQQTDAAKDADRLGRLLSRDDLSETGDAKDDHTVVVARRPRYDDLRRGRFRRREPIFGDLIARFDAWWAGVADESAAERLPVFWIDGRSGDGKSVLMLQLAQHLLERADPLALVGELSPEEVPDWVAAQAKTETTRRASPQRPVLAMIDDMHAVSDLEDWDLRLREATQDHLPRVALLACGPMPERKVLQRTCGLGVGIAPSTVPLLGDTEVSKTIDWFHARTGKEIPQGIASAENRPLVVLLFELAQGQSLGDFQKNFRRRLQSQGAELFVVAREILALNALELPAPAQILDSLADAQMDFFRRLCEESQLHFEHVAQNSLEPFAGYRLAHPQIGWWLYQAWTPVNASLATAWARDVGAALTRCSSASDADIFSHNMLFRFGNTERLAEAKGHTDVGSSNDAIRELYGQCSEDLRVRMLPRWLEHLYRRSELTLTPDPVQLAFDACSAGRPHNNLHPSVGAWLWRLSETSRFAKHAGEMRRHAQSLLSRDPPPPGTAQSLAILISNVADPSAAERLVGDWIKNNLTNDMAYWPLASLVANRPQDEKVAEQALDWIENNPKHTNAYQVLGTLVANRPQDESVAKSALEWIENNPKHTNAYQVLDPGRQPATGRESCQVSPRLDREQSEAHQRLRAARHPVANRPQDESVAKSALDWIENNPKHANAYELLGTLVANRPQDESVAESALDWIENNPKHTNAYQLLGTLVANRPQDESVAKSALD